MEPTCHICPAAPTHRVTVVRDVFVYCATCVEVAKRDLSETPVPFEVSVI